MKTIKKPLFAILISTKLLSTAFDLAIQHKMKRAVVRKAVAHKNQIIYKLQKLLKEGKLVLPTHYGVDINDGISAKARIIVKPSLVYDLILQWAVILVMQEYMEKGMYEWSCGSVKGRGGVYAKNYLSKFIKENPKYVKYCAKGDIYHFFQSIPIDKFKLMLDKKFRDKEFLKVVFQILDCNIINYRGKMIDIGLPIGFYTSQHFANWYLQGLDHYIKEQLHIKCYVRYVDDFVLLGNNKKELHKALAAISDYLNSIGLKLKSNYQVFRFIYTDKNGKERGRFIDFMGYKFYRDKVILRRKLFYKMMRKFKKISKLKVIDVHSARQATCYMGYIKHTNSYRLFNERIKPLVNIGKCKKIVSNYDKRKGKKNAISLEKSGEP